ncbi:uncharacterized protein LOC121770419 [Salvia splendens]|uniref:uncharacterized protein LOC121770419 n=1 Tax=Salvia splendens TaxID=180675 RepID=UPI001C253541|nr:uncharacterized protein LOC121770419 [Salvia splendens]
MDESRESHGKQYVDGMIEYMHRCDLEKWSKLEVDDFIEKKLGLYVSELEYFYLKTLMNLKEGLVRLFDNKSSMDMAEIGVKAWVVDLYVVDTTGVLVSQVIQDHGEATVDDGKSTDKENGRLDAAVKGKSKVDVVEEDNVEVPPFVDSDYDLSDKDKDNIMATQVKGWKRVVDVMARHPTDDTIDSDQLPRDSPSSGSEDEEEKEHYDDTRRLTRRYKADTERNDPRWEIGLRFNSKADFKDLIRHQGVSRLHNKHKCGGASYNHGCANVRYLAKKYKEDIRVIPGMTVGQFIEKVHSDMKITISPGKAKRAMQHAWRLIEVDLVKQYKRLHDYKAEILRTNPGSTVVLAKQWLEDGYDRFKAIYIAYEACKNSFKRHCRRLIGLDGCHLKGQAKGILLTAIGLDPNDQIFSIAFVVVCIENTDTWNRFLGLLVQDLEITDSSKWTFISDRKKGLINAMRNYCPHVVDNSRNSLDPVLGSNNVLS